MPLPPPARQPYGPPYDEFFMDDFVAAGPVIGQLNPHYEERLNMQSGRHLAGFSGIEDEAGYRGDIVELERLDDVNGSGIFDGPGRTTVNGRMGVFEDHYSRPGYIAREQLFTESREVIDLPSDGEAAVIVVPAGGAQLEHGRLLRPPMQQPMPPLPPIPVPQYQEYAWSDQAHAARRLPQRQIVHGPTLRAPLGAEPPKEGPGLGTYAFVGLVLGASVAMVLGAVNMKPGRARV